MTDSVFKLAVAKFGCIGAAPLLDLILDERADRKDLEIRGFTSGAKLDPDSCNVILDQIKDYVPDLVLIVTPNAALPGASGARDVLAEASLPTITISDGPSKKAFIGKDDDGKKVIKALDGQGFIILPSDPMIGARREFLDPTEMSIFNGEVIKVLAATGVTRFIQLAIDKVVAEIKQGNTAEMPRLVADAEDVVSQAGFSNPYAAAKAIAALTMSETVAKLTTKACFMEKDAEKYIPLAAAGHEVLRAAVMLADEAREMEKSIDMVNRTPHSSSGETKRKNKLADKPV
ncbi:MAG: F420-dependent methylenetetrahydromethanopterin dehydrogenase [Gammaproteobacteria bacterium]|jgi:methylenetetrahydromethanopterin dehydrogenase|nr:F420-dependent methylenetetrahydromethanopterin dehydrogenase [Gammaproteobacteria bacterium]